MTNMDLLTAVAVATFGGGIFFGIILVVAAGIRTQGQLAWRRGTVTLRDDPASRLAHGIRRINGVGVRVWDIDGRPSRATRPEPAEPVAAEE
jgi:hypothetical protein